MPPLLEIKGAIPPSLKPTAVDEFNIVPGLKMQSTSGGHVRVQMSEDTWLVLRDTKYKDVLTKRDTILGRYEYDSAKVWTDDKTKVKYFSGRLPEMVTTNSVITAVEL